MSDLIEIRFTIEQDGVSFTDCLYLPVDHSYTESEIATMQVERYENWKSVLAELSAADPVINNG